MVEQIPDEDKAAAAFESGKHSVLATLKKYLSTLLGRSECCMPYRKAWQREVARDRGEVAARQFMARVQTQYDEFYAVRTKLSHAST